LDELVQNVIFVQQRQTHTKIDEPLSINIFTTRNNADQSTTTLNYKFVYHLALENFEWALEIYRTSFYLQNFEYGSTLENIGYLYEIMKNGDKH
jgi:hypothetical protein